MLIPGSSCDVEAEPFAFSSGMDAATQTRPADLPLRYVAVACTLRSGSNLLCDMLRANGFGNPKEWFQSPGPPDQPATKQHDRCSSPHLENQLRRFVADHGPARWRGVKWDWRQFQQVRGLLHDVPAYEAEVQGLLQGQWFLLLRRDLASQAVSLYAAQLTGAWMGEEAAALDRLPQDFDAIYERFAQIAGDVYCWETYFREPGPTPVRLFHEDLVSTTAADWLSLLRRLDPGFESNRLDLSPLAARPREHARITEIKCWFREQMLAGRRPRSVLAVLEEVGSLVARAEREMPVECLLGRLAADLVAPPGVVRLQKLDLSRDLQRTGPASLVQQSHFNDGLALRLDPGASSAFPVRALKRLLIEFHTHAWSGIARVGFDDGMQDIDLFVGRPATRHFVHDFPTPLTGTVTIQCTGRRNILSQGAEVWLQRILLMSAEGT